MLYRTSFLCITGVFRYGLIFILSVSPSLCVTLYNATNVCRYCRWRQHKGLGGLSAFQQRRVIMADSTTGDGVMRALPAAVAGTFWPVWILGPFILGFNQLHS